ncbi:glycolate oxidase subunit GlcF [Pseudorhodoplanes sp.]|jgi:glycolate oxidase iron-sulfur subunit|uniref:glycolate oxidase subunit GlcF n=1 Tax=Pseudorhodoplanes sp. TaxID=1934341 RepID=UPI002BD313EF|nr:glycolate oxidase subunit GlcF [Pseudorhodoplanes sp.]HWV41533.1 glycolate oxidase subunit GlcF [Pseudorhodoplanes sp.]
MQTRFSLAQLADPDTAESNKILRACVHCGFCTATCPTYVLLGDELDSPRGRIYLIKDMLEQGRPATADVVKHIDRCLSCLSCMTTCPSGVHYMHLVDHARAHIEKTYRRPWRDRLMRSLLATVLPYPGRLRVALTLAPLARPFAGLLSAIGLKPLSAMLRLAPTTAIPATPPTTRIHPAEGTRRGRVALLQGCANQVLGEHVNAATIRVLNRLGIEVVTPEEESCCGALVHHMGRERQSHAQARANIDLWMREIEGAGLDAIVINVSGCGTTVKDYGFMLRTDPAYAEKAARVSSLAKDISEYLVTLPASGPVRQTGLTVAYHAACSLQHGQRVIRQPKELLTRHGFIVRDIPEGHLCCGSAGTYNILQSDIAQTLRDRKIANIAQLSPDVIAAGNIGCMTQIASGTAIPVVHPVELIDWATGGPKPTGLSGGAQAMPGEGDLVTVAKTQAPA